jgi:hypothetical protein
MNLVGLRLILAMGRSYVLKNKNLVLFTSLPLPVFHDWSKLSLCKNRALATCGHVSALLQPGNSHACVPTMRVTKGPRVFLSYSFSFQVLSENVTLPLGPSEDVVLLLCEGWP